MEAPMPGMIVSYNVAVNDKIKEGDLLCVLEAMKMNNNITAPKDCVVKSIPLKPGDSVFIKPDTVHASFNTGDRAAKLIAVLGPCVGEDGYEFVDVSGESPWSTLR